MCHTVDRVRAYISIHALLAESDAVTSVARVATTVISIHALLAESDLSMETFGQVVSAISIHALLAESDHIHAPNRRPYHYFYPRSPCGERPSLNQLYINRTAISIHALLAESDAMQIVVIIVYALFLSTLSLRRATAS